MAGTCECGTVLEERESWVRFPMGVTGFFIDLILGSTQPRISSEG